MRLLPEPDDVDFVVAGADPDPGSREATARWIEERKRRPEHAAELEEAREILAALGIDTPESGAGPSTQDAERPRQAGANGRVVAGVDRAGLGGA